MSDAGEQPKPPGGLEPPLPDAAKCGCAGIALGVLMYLCIGVLPEGRYHIGELDQWLFSRAFSGVLGAVVVGLGLYATRRGRGPVVGLGLLSIVIGGCFFLRAARV